MNLNPRVAVLMLLLGGRVAAAPTPMTFGGWMDVYADVSVIEARPELFTSVSFGMYGISPDGSITRSPHIPPRDEVVKWARSHGIKIYATLGGDPKLLPPALSGTLLEHCLTDIRAVVERDGFDGVDVDIEELAPSAKPVYNQFVVRLAALLKAMHPARRLSVTVQNFQNAKEEQESFLDYAFLANLADEIRVMHYTCPWGEPGPIMPRTAFKEAVEYARSRIPKSKYVAALPWYGDDWDLKTNNSEDILWQMTETATGIVGPGEMPSRFGGAFTWREPEGELSFSYTRDGIGHQVWMPDARTFAWMVDDVKKAGASGIYVYQLEYASPAYLDVIAKELKVVRP